MRNLYTILAIAILTLSSCKNIEKMVDRGNYDEAIGYAVDKLEGKKNKKTKYVKALEKAFAKVNNQDLETIAKLELSNSTTRYDRIYDIYHRMDRRQITVDRLSPLVSEDGYIADFNFVNYSILIAETSNKASETHYHEAHRLLANAVKYSKYDARAAYEELHHIERYHPNYKDTDSLYEEAYSIGVDHVGVDIKVNDYSLAGTYINDVMYNMDLSSLDNFWTVHHLGTTNVILDYKATIEIQQIDPGFEREQYNTYVETAEIEDGTKEVIDLNGNIVKDTLGNTILTKKYRTVSAEITEMSRLKSARLQGKTFIHDLNSNSLVRSVPLEVTHIFEDYKAIYRGDDRALTAQTKRKLKNYCNVFPSDIDMIAAMAGNFRDSALEILKDR